MKSIYSKTILVVCFTTFLIYSAVVLKRAFTEDVTFTNLFNSATSRAKDKLTAMKITSSVTQINNNFDHPIWKALVDGNGKPGVPILREELIITEYVSSEYYIIEQDRISYMSPTLNKSDINDHAKHMVQRSFHKEIFTPLTKVINTKIYSDLGVVPSYWSIKQNSEELSNHYSQNNISSISNLYSSFIHKDSLLNNIRNKTISTSYNTSLIFEEDGEEMSYTVSFSDNNQPFYKLTMLSGNPECIKTEKLYKKDGALKEFMNVEYNSNLEPVRIKKYSLFGDKVIDEETDENLKEHSMFSYEININSIDYDFLLKESGYDVFQLIQPNDTVHDELSGKVYVVGNPKSATNIVDVPVHDSNKIPTKIKTNE